jgi:lipopolysaccharide assembly protein A
MQKFRLGFAILIASFVLIVILQNTEPVETRVLFLSVTMPRAVLLLVTTVIGFLLGILWSVRHLGARDGRGG